MVAELRRIPAMLLRTAPQLLAWLLAGEVVRAGVLSLAAPIGPETAIGGLLLVPLAVLARLIAYIGMFLVLRRELQAFRSLAGAHGIGGPAGGGVRGAVGDIADILLASIVPFFTIYGLIGGVQGDLRAYANASFAYSFGAEHNGTDLSADGALVVVVIVVAFLGRVILKRFGSRLPSWVTIVSIYLEATWIFVAVSGIQISFADIYDWVMNRQIVTWYLDAKDAIRGLWEGFRFAIDGFDALLPVLTQLILLPLAWLLVAGVIYTRALADAARVRIVPRRLEVGMRVRLARTPRLVRHQARIVAEGWDELGRPVLVAARIILRAGILPIGVFLFAYAVVYAAAHWLERGLYALVGPHDLAFWVAWQPLLALAALAVVEPLRIALLGSAFDAGLARWAERDAARHAAAAPTATLDAAVSRSGRVGGRSRERSATGG